MNQSLLSGLFVDTVAELNTKMPVPGLVFCRETGLVYSWDSTVSVEEPPYRIDGALTNTGGGTWISPIHTMNYLSETKQGGDVITDNGVYIFSGLNLATPITISSAVYGIISIPEPTKTMFGKSTGNVMELKYKDNVNDSTVTLNDIRCAFLTYNNNEDNDRWTYCPMGPYNAIDIAPGEAFTPYTEGRLYNQKPIVNTTYSYNSEWDSTYTVDVDVSIRILRPLNLKEIRAYFVNKSSSTIALTRMDVRNKNGVNSTLYNNQTLASNAENYIVAGMKENSYMFSDILWLENNSTEIRYLRVIMLDNHAIAGLGLQQVQAEAWRD